MKYNICAAVCILSSITLTAQTKPDTSQWKTYTDTAYHFTMQYPAWWEFKPQSTNTRFFVTSYKENEADAFRENLNCLTRTIDQPGFTIDKAEAAIKKSLAGQLTDYKLIRSGYITWNGVQTLELDYTCTKESGGASYNIHMYQRMAIVKNTLFTLTFTSDAAAYTRYLPTVKKMLASLKVK
jgi:eukaryotic-like serine/threonine-protein kinase